jgi:hypothetical protein
MFFQNDRKRFNSLEVTGKEVPSFFAIKTRRKSSHPFFECQVAAP